MENLQIIAKDFFEKIGFNFEKDFKPKPAVSFPFSDQNLYDNKELTEKLTGNLFIFDSQNQDLHTSFYLLTIHLEPNELTALRLFIWNENKYDLYFTCQKIGNKTENETQNEVESETDLSILLYLSSINPKETDLDKKAQIASFQGRDTNLIEKISKTHFTTGALWLAYAEKLEKLKKDAKTIDKNLIETLRQLYKNLDVIYKPLFAKYEGREKADKEQIVPALIDRTLFIKFLEDKHIINSTFYKTCFGDGEINYKKLLANKDREKINKLFKIINDVFNNTLFQTPNIKNEELPDNALMQIYNAISQTKQEGNIWILSLFDFQFDVLPTEFIGHIYEMFFTGNEKKDGGIFYTPKNLAQLIVNQTINKVGTILDPACGSGMFLVMAYKRLLDLSNFKPTKDVKKIIEQRNKLINENIFGIEKENKARRIAIFSLYLEILDNIDNTAIEKYVNEKILQHAKSNLFPEIDFPTVFPKKLSFADNIVEANSLVEKDKQPHKELTFDFIVGNPPFQNKGYGEDEKVFLDKASIELLENEKIAIKNIVVGGQLSQAFMAKIKDWSKSTTRFGFVQNSTNFDNEIKNFTNFFFAHYKVEKFYDLSNLREILFANTKETVCVTIFDNTNGSTTDFQYFCPELNKFSKAFKLILHNESKIINIQQADLLAGKVRMRDYVVGNEYDKELVGKLKTENRQLKDFILADTYYGLGVGMRLSGQEMVWENSEVSKEDYKKLDEESKEELQKEYANLHSRKEATGEYNVPFVALKQLDAFRLKGVACYIRRQDIENRIFRDNRNYDFFVGERILMGETPRTKQGKYMFISHFILGTETVLATRTSIFSIRLKDRNYYYLFTAILNSTLMNYYFNIDLVKRAGVAFPKIPMIKVPEIPIPTHLDKHLVAKISALSQEFCNRNRSYKGDDFEKLNELVFELYDLNILEINRIKDFFAEKRVVNDKDFEAYKTMLFYTIELVEFETPPVIKYFVGKNMPFGMAVVALYFNNAEKKQPDAKKMAQGLLNEMLKANIDEPFISLQSIYYGLNCIYIFKENILSNWTQTKAYEDGQEIIATLSANEQKY